MIDPKRQFFCTAPWSNIFQQGNHTSPCHTNTHKFSGLSPLEYLNSDFLKGLKQDFLDGKVPPSCEICKHREDLGIRSTRQSVLSKHGRLSVQPLDENSFIDRDPNSITRIELRTTNLCNFKCRMCNFDNSSEIARENNLEHKIYHASEKVIEELKAMMTDTLNTLCLTGGEPQLIKEYCEFLDHLIDNNYTDIVIELFTNCSVYNPLFIERLSKFRTIDFIMSIDGVGKTAEYQRKGTIWNVVENNIYKFLELKHPFNIKFNTAISPYVLMDVFSLSKFLMKLHTINPNIVSRCYATVKPDPLHFVHMPENCRKVAIEQIDSAMQILTTDNFNVFKTELFNIKKILVDERPINPNMFIQYTKKLDMLRNEKFEDVFGISLS